MRSGSGAVTPVEELTIFLRHCAGKSYPQLSTAVADYLASLPSEALAALVASGNPLPRAEARQPSEEVVARSYKLPPGWRPHYGGPCPVQDRQRVEVWTRGNGSMGLKVRASFWRRAEDLWRWEGSREHDIVGFKVCE